MYKHQCLWKSSSSSDSSCEIHKICKFSSFIYMTELLDSSHGHFLIRAPYCHSINELVMLQNSESISIYTDLTIISLPLFTDDNCRLGDYKKLKTKMLDLHAQRYLTPSNHGSHENDMATRKHLVDMMFKRFDADGNGRVDSSELSQVKSVTKSISFFSFTCLIYVVIRWHFLAFLTCVCHDDFIKITNFKTTELNWAELN